jgi:hypothetical protein
MNRFIGPLTIVTTLSYHYFEIAVTVTHNKLPLFRYKTALSELISDTDCHSIHTSQLTNLLYVSSTLAAYKTPLQMYYWKQCLWFSCPATSYSGVFIIVVSHSRLRECLPSRCLVTTTFLYCCAFEHAYRAIAWQRLVKSVTLF